MQIDLSAIDALFGAIPSSVLWTSFGIFWLAIALFSAFLLYHWKKYELYSPASRRARLLFGFGIALLLLFSAGALHLFTIA